MSAAEALPWWSLPELSLAVSSSKLHHPTRSTSRVTAPNNWFKRAKQLKTMGQANLKVGIDGFSISQISILAHAHATKIIKKFNQWHNDHMRKGHLNMVVTRPKNLPHQKLQLPQKRRASSPSARNHRLDMVYLPNRNVFRNNPCPYVISIERTRISLSFLQSRQVNS